MNPETQTKKSATGGGIRFEKRFRLKEVLSLISVKRLRGLIMRVMSKEQNRS
jgi:hypothetical protein